MPIRGIILLAFIAASVPVCFVRPFYGIILWTVLGILNPQSSLFYWPVALAFPWAEAVAVPTIGGSLIFSAALRRIFCREGVLLVLIWAWFTATTINSVHTPLFAPNAASTWEHWEIFSKIVLMTLVTLGLTDTWQRFRWMIWAAAGSFGYIILKAVPFMIMTGGMYRIYGPPNSMVADNNDMGLALNMTLPMFYFLAKTESDRRVKWLMAGLFAASIPAIFLTYSRGALIGLIAVFACMLAQARQKAILAPVAIMVTLFAALLVPQVWRDRMSTTNPEALDASALSRLNAWTYSWRLASDYPITGGGFDAFTPELFDLYAPNTLDVHGPHSIYFGVLAEHGFIGLALYLLLVLSCFVSLHRIAKRCPQSEHGPAAYARMLQFAIVGFLVSGAFLGRAYFDYFFTIIACTAALRQLVTHELEDEALEEETEDELLEASATQ